MHMKRAEISNLHQNPCCHLANAVDLITAQRASHILSKKFILLDPNSYLDCHQNLSGWPFCNIASTSVQTLAEASIPSAPRSNLPPSHTNPSHSPPFPFITESQKNPSKGSGGNAVSSQVGSEAEPELEAHFYAFWALKTHLMATF